MLYFLLLFIGVPLIELYFLIRVGGLIGALPTVLLVISTAFIGITLLRSQGFAVMLSARQRLNSGAVPAQEIFEGVLMAAAGLFLLTPGFITDVLGFLLLIPALRKQIFAYILLKIFQKYGYRAQPAYRTPSNDTVKVIVDAEVKLEKD